MSDTINAGILRLRKVRSLSAIFLSALIFSFLFTSCKKDTTDIGLGLLKGSQLSGYYAELHMITHSKVMDSVKTNNPAALLCGNYYDPYLGVTSASFYTQLFPSTTGVVSFGPSPVIDSIVLSLPYKSYYGKPAPLRFKVYRMLQQLYIDSTYYSFTNKRTDNVPLADVTVEPNTVDSVHADSTTYPPQLRIKLNTSLLHFLIDSSVYITNDIFLSHFEGIQVSAFQTNLSGNRAIYSFLYTDTRSKVTMYYRNSLSPLHELKYDFLMAGQAARFNHFDHDYSTVPAIQSQLTTLDTMQENTVYVQGLAGLQTKMYFPDLSVLRQNGEPVAINRAELEVRADLSTIDDNYFPAPANLVVVALDANEHYLSTPDLFEGGAYSGGTYDAANHEYVFNIARYLQQVLSGKITDRGLMIIPSGGGVYPNRVVLGGGGSSSPYRIKLKVTYTKK